MVDTQSLKKVILFDKEEPAIGWMYLVRDHTQSIFRVARCIEDAQENRGEWVMHRHIQTYTDDLWAACERWFAQRRQHRQDFEMLRKGKIPDAQLALWRA